MAGVRAELIHDEHATVVVWQQDRNGVQSVMLRPDDALMLGGSLQTLAMRMGAKRRKRTTDGAS